MGLGKEAFKHFIVFSQHVLMADFKAKYFFMLNFDVNVVYSGQKLKKTLWLMFGIYVRAISKSIIRTYNIVGVLKKR